MLLSFENPIFKNVAIQAETFLESCGGSLSRDTSLGWASSLSDCLVAQGYKYMGEGHFSMVFSHELFPDNVVKISLKSEDSSAAYAAFCREFEGMVGIPKIHDLTKVCDCFMVILDKYQDFNRYATDEHRSIHFAMERVMMGYSEERDEPIINTAKRIYSFFKDIARMDLHSENIMIDNTGNLIITDPVSYSQVATTKVKCRGRIPLFARTKRSMGFPHVKPRIPTMARAGIALPQFEFKMSMLKLSLNPKERFLGLGGVDKFLEGIRADICKQAKDLAKFENHDFGLRGLESLGFSHNIRKLFPTPAQKFWMDEALPMLGEPKPIHFDRPKDRNQNGDGVNPAITWDLGEFHQKGRKGARNRI